MLGRLLKIIPPDLDAFLADMREFNVIKGE